MAKMIPMELKEGEYLSEGEKEVFEILKNSLNDEWVVIYSLRWAIESEVFLGRSSGESDFVLLHKEHGIMIIEVKGGIVSCINGEWSSVSQNNIKHIIKNPEQQASDAKFNLLSRFRKSNVNPYITTAVWFPDTLKSKCSLPLSMPKEIILDMTAFKNIEKSIIDIFEYRKSKESFNVSKLVESDYNKIMDILNPKVDIKVPLLRLANKVNMKFMRLNEEQNNFFEQLDDNNYISVSGHAGTGKTVLAVRKALRESEEGKKVLFLCYNNLLKENIREENHEEFEVFTINSLGVEYLSRYNKEAFDKFEETVDFEVMMEDFIEEIKNNRTKNKMFFDSIIIDEGQDFTKEWIEALDELLNPKGSVCIFYDENQMIYNKYGRNDINFVNRGTKYTLNRNMRNTDEIFSSALNVIKANREKVKFNGVKGIEPDIIFTEGNLDAIEQLKNIINLLKRDEYLGDDNIAVLTMEAKKKLKFKKGISNEFSGTVESIRRFKGLESDIVIIPDISNEFMEDEDLKNLLYVGMSRAKAHIILMIDTEVFTRKQKVDYKKKIKTIFSEK